MTFDKRTEGITRNISLNIFLSLNICHLIFPPTHLFFSVPTRQSTIEQSESLFRHCGLPFKLPCQFHQISRWLQLSTNIQIYIKLPVAGQLAVETRSRRSIKFKFPFSTNFPCCHHHISIQLLCSYDIEPSIWRCQFKLKLAFHQVFTRYLPRCHSLSETIDC